MKKADKKIKEQAKKLALLLEKNRIKVKKIILFGSRAKGKEKKYSDIDFAVISPDFGKDELKEIMLLAKLSWKVSDNIEAIPLNEKLLKSKYHPLIGEIKKYGITVFSN